MVVIVVVVVVDALCVCGDVVRLYALFLFLGKKDFWNEFVLHKIAHMMQNKEIKCEYCESKYMECVLRVRKRKKKHQQQQQQ